MSQKIKWLAWGFTIFLLVATRFVNLDWGLPFPLHPDERNMVSAIQRLSCENVYDLKNCFNPEFFAYGQFPLYLGYLLIILSRLITQITGSINFSEGALALRFISAAASLGVVYYSLKILGWFIPNTLPTGRQAQYRILYIIPFIFSPALIQFAHFGTTESLLMFFFTYIVYLCLMLKENRKPGEIESIYVRLGIVVGLAIATKVSALTFIFVPLIAITALHTREKNESRYQSFLLWLNEIVFVGFISGAVAILFSPHNLISWNEFMSSMKYESEVALGTTKVFYTRVFEGSTPMLFQLKYIFPFALGIPTFVLFCVGLFTLPRTWKHNFLWICFFIFFIPWSFAYTKWTRFMAPLFPLMIILSILTLFHLYEKIFRKNRVLLNILVVGMSLPGILFSQIYLHKDIRFRASDWMAKNIPEKSIVLQDTGNVVDLPLLNSQTKNISFDFYNLDGDTKLQHDLKKYLQEVDYIIVPSRRIFKNHLKDKYPFTAQYYEDLFSGKLGFTQVAEFKDLNDENAEETWTVFDHPVIRIYKRI